MGGEEMISATSGHDIKYKASQKLSDEVARWLAKGNEIKGIEKPLIIKEKESGEKSKHEISQEKVRNSQVRDSMARASIQKPLIVEYAELANNKNMWRVVVDMVSGIVSTSQLCNIKGGRGTIANNKVWVEVEAVLKKLIKELRDEKSK